ncbi:hypothetical protein, partial [Enterococcus faecalis]
NFINIDKIILPLRNYFSRKNSSFFNKKTCFCIENSKNSCLDNKNKKINNKKISLIFVSMEIRTTII